MASVSLSHVVKRFDDGTTAVDDVSFTIADGTFLVIVGPSGCGKSTTLRMIAGLETITDGEIAIDGRVVNDVHPKDRDIAMVFQNYALYPHMTVRDNLAFALKMRDVSREEIVRRVAEAARMLELEPLLDRKPRALSGGQRQRVALGRAIVRNPRVFLFDEPLSNLDARLRTQTRAELQRLHHTLRATSIYVTHDQTEAMTMADVIVVMNDGRVQQIASPMELYNNPTNRFVAGFIGTPAMNLFDGVIEARDGGTAAFRQAGTNGVTLPLAGLPPGWEETRAVGVRPEHFEVTTADDPLALHARAEVIETLGHQTLVYFPTASGVAAASIDPSRHVVYGDLIPLRVAPDRLYLFDGGGERIDVTVAMDASS